MNDIVRFEYVHPPVPSRQYDWQATVGYVDENSPIGRGPTKEAALADLIAQVMTDEEDFLP